MLLDRGSADHVDKNCNPASSGSGPCQLEENAINAERDREASKWRKIGIGVSLAGAVLGGVGLYFALRPSPIDDREARDLAEEYNAKLRIAPYVEPAGGGLALSGRF